MHPCIGACLAWRDCDCDGDGFSANATPRCACCRAVAGMWALGCLVWEVYNDEPPKRVPSFRPTPVLVRALVRRVSQRIERINDLDSFNESSMDPKRSIAHSWEASLTTSHHWYNTKQPLEGARPLNPEP